MEDERSAITWYCGVEVHELLLVLALYGICFDQVYLGPISQYEPTELGYAKITQELTRFSIHRFLMETTGIFHFEVKWALEERFPNAQVIVMNAWNIAQFIKRVRKSDRVDAIKLAQIARYDELLRVSYCPSRDSAYLREITRQRSHLIEELVRFKNRVKKLFAMYGFRWAFNYQTQWQVNLVMDFLRSTQDFGTFIINDPTLSPEDRKPLLVWASFNPPSHVRDLLLFEFHQIGIQAAEIDLMEGKITDQVQQRPELDHQIKSLDTVPGLGWMNSVAILTEIGDIKRFPTAGKFAVVLWHRSRGRAFSGAPQLNSPAEKPVVKDHPNKKCNPMLKTIFTQAAMVLLKLARNGNQVKDLTRYAAKFAAHKDKRIKYRFKVAAKLIRQVYHCLTMGEQFNDQGDVAHPQQIRPKEPSSAYSSESSAITPE